MVRSLVIALINIYCEVCWWKNYENRSIVVENMNKSWMWRLFGYHLALAAGKHVPVPAAQQGKKYHLPGTCFAPASNIRPIWNQLFIITPYIKIFKKCILAFPCNNSRCSCTDAYLHIYLMLTGVQLWSSYHRHSKLGASSGFVDWSERQLRRLQRCWGKYAKWH